MQVYGLCPGITSMGVKLINQAMVSRFWLSVNKIFMILENIGSSCCAISPPFDGPSPHPRCCGVTVQMLFLLQVLRAGRPARLCREAHCGRAGARQSPCNRWHAASATALPPPAPSRIAGNV